jgi:hypothetical protein
MPLNDHEVGIVKGMLARGDRQHDIAAYFGVNSARVAEVLKGQRGEGVMLAPTNTLPPPGPYLAGRSALRARDTLMALRDLIDEAIKDIDLYEQRDEPPDTP